MIISTAHKSKGREWNTVRIGAGFHAPAFDETGLQRPLRLDEARLIYVAVTRARRILDQSSLSWIGEYEKRAAETGQGMPRSARRAPAHRATEVLRVPGFAFMAEHLPHVGPLHVQYLKFAAALPHPVQPVDVRSPAWAALGHAIDYRLRLSLGSGLGSRRVPRGGPWSGPDALPGAPDTEARVALQAPVSTAHRCSTFDGRAPRRRQLSRLCFVAASYEAVYRTGRVQRGNMLVGRLRRPTLSELTAAVPEYAVEDLARQFALATGPFRCAAGAAEEQKVCGPAFAGSADLGGADADFILDGLLLDCKATRYPRSLGREEIYQLAGYLLLDYEDRFGINHLGLYLSRQGAMITWSVEEFLQALGCSRSLASLRGLLQLKLRGHQSLADVPARIR